MARGYEYDLFVSYKHAYPIGAWVQNHFMKKLTGRLASEGLPGPRIYIDKRIKTGVAWEYEIEHALRTSRCLVAILSPEYFYSGPCLTEYYTMSRRERLTGFLTPKNPQGLIFPVIYSDCDELPHGFKRTQYINMKELNFPDEVFERDPRYIQFDEQMKRLCQELIPMIKAAPKWSASWPIVHKKARPITNAPFPRIR
jgi:hypothetical protein